MPFFLLGGFLCGGRCILRSRFLWGCWFGFGFGFGSGREREKEMLRTFAGEVLCGQCGCEYCGLRVAQGFTALIIIIM